MWLVTGNLTSCLWSSLHARSPLCGPPAPSWALSSRTLTSTHEMGSGAQTSIWQMETLRQSIFQLLSSSLYTRPLRRSRLGDARVSGHCEELLTVVGWVRVPPPGKQTTSTGSWVKFRSLHDSSPFSDLQQVPSTLGRPPRHDRKSWHSWTCAPRVFLASALPTLSPGSHPAAHPGAWRAPGGFRELHPTLVLGFQIQVLFPRKNQFLLLKNAAPSPTHIEAVAQTPEGMRHRICDFGQVTFWTWKWGEGDLVWSRGPPDQMVAEVSGDVGQRLPQTGAPLGKVVLC